MRIPTKYRNQAIDAIKAKARKLGKEIRTARMGPCLIPANERDGPCDPELNNCHLVGLNHLAPIAKNGHVYEWDMTQIPNAATNWIKHGTVSDDPNQISFGEIHPANLNIRKCTRRPVCKAHDGPIFRATDRKDLDPYTPDHQFRMGFRGIAGSLALLESLTDFTNSIKGQARVDGFWVSRGKADTVEHNLATALQVLERRADSVRAELTRWQALYLDWDNREAGIVSSAGPVVPQVRVACSSIYYVAGRTPVALNIVPAQSGRKATIVVTARKSRGWTQRFWNHKNQLSMLSEARDQIITMLEEDPASGIAHLAQNTLHFVANKDDFDDSNLITGDQRQSIARTVANLLQ